MSLINTIRKAKIIIIIGVLGFVVWGAFFPLAQGIVVDGEVTVVGKNKNIEHPRGGSVKSILVNAGDKIEAGDLLLELKDEDTQFALNATFSEKLGLLQSSSELEANVALMKDQLELAKKRLASLQSLVDENFYSENYLFEVQQKINEHQSRLNDRLIEQKKNLSRLSELEEKILGYENTIEEFKIKSPAAGVIKNLHIHSLGEVVKPGVPIVEITPNDAQFEVEAKIPVTLIDKLENESTVEVSFPHLQKSLSPKLNGHLYFISPDKEQPDNEAPFFLGKIQLSDTTYLNNSFNIKFGMPCQVFIASEPRTFFNYLFKPIIDNFSVAFKN